MYERPDESRVLEGVMTTLSEDGELNVAPMGPIVTEAMDRLVLRPFNTSTTYANMKATGVGVFHVTDDVLLLARAAIGKVTDVATVEAANVRGLVLADCCRYYELKVESLDDASERVTIVARVVAQNVRREFFGFNRAKHAVLEAAILATRVHMTGAAEVLEAMKPLEVMVAKTGASAERDAMEMVRAYVEGFDQK